MEAVVGSHNKRDTEAAARKLEDDAYNRMMGNAPALPAEPTAIKDSLRAYEAHLKDAREHTEIHRPSDTSARSRL